MSRLATRFLIIALSALLISPAILADTYKIDPVHSAVVFKAGHLKTSYVFGRFDQKGGTINLDPSNPGNTSFQITIQTDSINTGNAQRDAHLKSPTFFSAKEFPTITFKSNSVKAAEDNKLQVSGDLTLHGQTKPITLTVEQVGSSNVPKFGQRVGYYTTLTVKRSDFGMTAMPDVVSDEIEVMAAFEAQKQ